MKLLAPFWCGVICYLSLTRIAPSLEHAWWHIPNLDKYIHIILYGILTVLLYLTYTRHFILIITLAAAYGLLMEYFQAWFTNYRSFDWADFGADTLGALLAYLFMLFIFPKLPFRILRNLQKTN